MGFYRERDAEVGGTDSAWTAAANFDFDTNISVSDMRADDDTRYSGVLSQEELATDPSQEMS